MENNELLYDIAFSMDESLTPIEKKSLFLKYGSSQAILSLKVSLLKNILGRNWTCSRFKADLFIREAGPIFDFISKSGIRAIRFDHPDYPYALKEIPDHPFMIYVRGQIAYDFDKSIAVVGTRSPDADGIRRAENITGKLVENGFVPVSGLALGIDSLSHRQAVNRKSPTLAVLGCGIDRIYPAENRELARQIIDSGGAVISEYPPGFLARKWYFPRRNRIIVGLSRAVLIIQSPENSGSRISGFLAADYNRELFICEPEKSDTSIDEGNRIMIRMGGMPVRDSNDILKELVYSANLV